MVPKRSKKELKLIDKNPFGDSDRDGVINYLDCKPLSKRWQDVVLYHGTNPRAAEQIRKEGLRTGHGINPVVYMTPNKATAMKYSQGIIFKARLSDKFAKKCNIPLKNIPNEVTTSCTISASKLREVPMKPMKNYN